MFMELLVKLFDAPMCSDEFFSSFSQLYLDVCNALSFGLIRLSLTLFSFTKLPFMLLDLSLQLKSFLHGRVEGRLRLFICLNEIVCSFELFLGRTATAAGALTGRGCLTRGAIGLSQDSRGLIGLDVMRVCSTLRHFCFIATIFLLRFGKLNY